MWLFALVHAAHGADVPPEPCDTETQIKLRAEGLNRLRDAAVEGRQNTADQVQAQLVEAYACGPVASVEAVARIWLANGILSHARGDDNGYRSSFAAAALLVPTNSERLKDDFDLYGEEHFKNFVEASRGAVPPGKVQLDRPLPDPRWVTFVDGARWTLTGGEQDVPSGLHLLQIGLDEEHIYHAAIFNVPAVPLTLDVPDLPQLPELPREPDPVRRKRVAHALLVGAAGAVTYGLTFGTNAAYYNSGTLHENRSGGLRAANDGLVLTAGGLGVTSAALLVRAFVAPRSVTASPERIGHIEPLHRPWLVDPVYPPMVAAAPDAETE